MLNRTVRNITVGSLNCLYLENVFINYIFDKHVKSGFGIK